MASRGDAFHLVFLSLFLFVLEDYLFLHIGFWFFLAWRFFGLLDWVGL